MAFDCEHRDMSIEDIIRAAVNISPTGKVTFCTTGGSGSTQQTTPISIETGSGTFLAGASSVTFTNTGATQIIIGGVTIPIDADPITFSADTGNTLNAITFDANGGSILITSVR